MPAEVISLLSSPSLGPSLVQPALPQSRPAQPQVAAPSTALTYDDDDDIFDLTADSPELRPRPSPKPTLQSEQTKPTYSPRSIAGVKRTREEQPAPVDAPVYFMSDDFDTTIDLDSSLPIKNGLDGDTRDTKKSRLSPARSGGNRSFERSHSATDQPNRPPVKQSGGVRRAQTLEDIEFYSSPVFSSKPTGKTTTATSRRLDPVDPFGSSPPPSAQPLPKRQSPGKAVEAAVASTKRSDINLDSDDPFASSPRPPQKPTSKPCPILLDDDDDDPFASSPKRDPVEKPKPQPPPATSTSVAKGKQRAESPKRRLNWDPISSSAPELQLPSDPFASSPPPPRHTLKKAVSEVIDLSDTEPTPINLNLESDDDFPDLDNFDAERLRVDAKKTSSSSAYRAPSKTTKPTSARTVTKKSADDKTRDKEAKAAEREQEKGRKKLEKEAAKEQKAREKERAAALAEVNKARTDKKVSTPEMIADLPSSLPPAITFQIQTLLKDLDVQHGAWDSPVDNVVKWRRKVASRFNDELGHWEPIPMRIQPDKYALVIMTASDFVAHALGPEGSDLEAHVLKMKRHFPDEQLIYLIEGLTPWMRKNRNVRNRQFVSAVRNQEPEAAAGSSSASVTQPRRRKNQQPQEYIDEDSVEDALLQLQVMHGVLIHHTNASVETAQWVAIFTQHISTVPYRKQREAANAAGAGFCMETGQVRTGEDVKDTYVRMLQEIVRVTAPIAYGVATKFDTVTELVKGLEEGGPTVLEDCRKSTNRDGGFSDRTVGKAVSKRIYKVFTGRDEWSTDV